MHIIENDGRYTIRCWHVAVMGAFHCEADFENTNDFCHINTDIHVLTDDQKRIQAQTAKQLLHIFLQFNRRQLLANIDTGDETGVHYFESIRKIGNKEWLGEHDRRPKVAKRTISTKVHFTFSV